MRATLALIATLGLAGACGGRQMLDLPATDGGAARASGAAGATGAAGAPGATGSAGSGVFPMPQIGPIDFTNAPATLSMFCDSDAGQIRFSNPCLVGQGAGTSHEVECTISTSTDVGWSFLVVLPPTQNPETVLPVTPTAVPVGDRSAHITKIEGALTFERATADYSEFVAGFRGNVTWRDANGRTFTCIVDDTIWAAAGGFI
jgi:hypothetical protein